MSNKYLDKTLDFLENITWGEPTYPSTLVKTCHELRTKRLSDFTIEDLRIMIGQNIGLKYLIPLAINKLKHNILASGDYYEGDLLSAVLRSDKNYWLEEKKNWEILCKLFISNKHILKQEITESIKNEWFDLYHDFKTIHIA